MKNWLNNLFKKNQKVDLNIIKDAIFEYRLDGKNLMFELGKKYGLDINNSKDYENLISRSNENIPRKGELSKSWNYYFHGCECGFQNKKNHKRVEVVLTNPPEFGNINSWFLLSYMQSTEKYKNEIKDMDWQELQKVVQKLYKNNEVENIE